MSSSRQRRKARTRQEILDTALQMIIEDGPQNLSLREVARRVDYSPAGLYEYFDGKDALIQALADEGYERLTAALNHIQGEAQGLQYLIEIGMAYVSFALQHPHHFQLIFTQSQSSRQSLGEAVGESPYGVVVKAVQEAIQSGELTAPDGVDVEQIAYNIWAFAHGIAMLQSSHLRDFDADFEKADRQGFEAYLKGLALL